MMKVGIAVVVVFAIGWFTLPEAQSRIIALAPFAIVLVCPLAMLFGMRGHGGHGGGGHGDHRTHGGCCGKEEDARAATSERKE